MKFLLGYKSDYGDTSGADHMLSNLESSWRGCSPKATAFGGGSLLIKKLTWEYGQDSSEFILATHGEAMLFGLPGLVKNLDARYLLEHALGHAGLLMVECQNGKLILRRE